MFVQIKSFLQEHWKFCLSISLCIVFFAICLIIYMRTSEKWLCQEFCVNFLEIFVVFFHQRAKPFINEQLVPDYRPID